MNRMKVSRGTSQEGMKCSGPREAGILHAYGRWVDETEERTPDLDRHHRGMLRTLQSEHTRKTRRVRADLDAPRGQNSESSLGYPIFLAAHAAFPESPYSLFHNLHTRIPSLFTFTSDKQDSEPASGVAGKRGPGREA